MNERFIRLTVNGEEMIGHPGNLELYTFAEPNQAMNHVFVTTEETEERQLGVYIFSHRSIYAGLSEFIRRNGYPRHEDLRRIPLEDARVYEEEIADLMDDIDTPPEWL